MIVRQFRCLNHQCQAKVSVFDNSSVQFCPECGQDTLISVDPQAGECRSPKPQPYTQGLTCSRCQGEIAHNGDYFYCPSCGSRKTVVAK